MSHTRRNIIVSITLVVVIILALLGRQLRRDDLSVDSAIASALRSEVQLNFDAPLFEFLTMPVPRVDSYDATTKTAVVGMYSWFGVRAAKVTLTSCQYYNHAMNREKTFECQGGSVEYFFGV